MGYFGADPNQCAFVSVLKGLNGEEDSCSEQEEFRLPFSARETEIIREKQILRLPPPYRKIRTNLYLTSKIPVVSDGTDTEGCRCNRVLGSSEPFICDENCINRMMMIECTDDSCSADTNQCCLNRQFTRRETHKTEIIDMQSKGFGLIALEPIKQSDFVIEYVGEVIDDEECERRIRLSQANGEKHFYLMEISKDAVIDARYRSNSARFLNHSCEPNCETQKWNVNGCIRVGIFALRDIEAGEELTMDYQFCHFGETAEQCLCGAPSCRQVLSSKRTDKVEAKKNDQTIKHPTVRPAKTTSFGLFKRANIHFSSLDTYGYQKKRLFLSHEIPSEELKPGFDVEHYATRTFYKQKNLNQIASSNALDLAREKAQQVIAHSSRGIVDWTEELALVSVDKKPKRRRIRRNLLQAAVKRLYDIEMSFPSDRTERLLERVRSTNYQHGSVDNVDDYNEDTCFRCGQAGELLCCDGCPAAYHLTCAGLYSMDTAQDWFCRPCRRKLYPGRR